MRFILIFQVLCMRLPPPGGVDGPEGRQEVRFLGKSLSSNLKVRGKPVFVENCIIVIGLPWGPCICDVRLTILRFISGYCGEPKLGGPREAPRLGQLGG